MYQENYLIDPQVGKNNTFVTLFDKNLNRINENLKFVNQYYTPKYEQPVEHIFNETEINKPNKPIDENINESVNFYNEFYKITMNEIESIRKTNVRDILSKKASFWECKKKENSNKLKSKNDKLMHEVRKTLTIDRNYAKELLDSSDNIFQTRLREEQIKFDQKAKNIKFSLALKIGIDLLDDIKTLLNESHNTMTPQFINDQMQNYTLFEENMNTYKNMSLNFKEHDLLALNQLVQYIQLFKEQFVKQISDKYQVENFSFKTDTEQNEENKIPITNNDKEETNEVHNLTSTMKDDSEVRSDQCFSFKLKSDEETVTCNNSISNFSFIVEDEKQEEIMNKSTDSANEYKQILDNYCTLKNHLEQIEKLYLSFLQDDNLKSLRQELKKSINTPVNTVSSVSSWHMKDKFEKLNSLLRCKTVKTGNSVVSANSHKDALIFCKDTLAQKCINIGEEVASVKIETAFEVASVITELWQVHPDFGVLLYARFKQKCPWLIPQHAAKTSKQTDEEYYKSLGYKYTDGIVEKQDKYIKRMTGIIRLFASIIVTETKSGKALGIAQAWMLIAATVNLDPQLDITAILLHEMLIITGYYLKKAYGKQFIKMLQFIDSNYMKKIDEVTPIGCGGPVQRLKTFISKVIQVGYIDKPKGIIPYNFW